MWLAVFALHLNRCGNVKYKRFLPFWLKIRGFDALFLSATIKIKAELFCTFASAFISVLSTLLIRSSVVECTIATILS